MRIAAATKPIDSQGVDLFSARGMGRQSAAILYSRADAQSLPAISGARVALRAGAAGALAAAFAVPLLRRRARIPAPVTIAACAAGPLAVAVLRPALARAATSPSSRCRCGPSSWSTSSPTTIPERLRSRLRSRYPIVVDRAIGLGRLPNVRLQRALARLPRVGAAQPGPDLGPLALVPRALLSRCSTSSSATPSTSRAPRAGSPPSSTSAAPSTSRCPTAPPWWASEQGADRRGGAADHGRGRRGVLGRGLAADVRRARRQPLGGDALAALRTSLVAPISLAETGQGRRARSAGPTR